MMGNPTRKNKRLSTFQSLQGKPFLIPIYRIVILPRLFRVFGLIRTIRIIRHRDHLKTGSRHLVGQNKKRTIGNGFDLDLCNISGKRHFEILFE